MNMSLRTKQPLHPVGAYPFPILGFPESRLQNLYSCGYTALQRDNSDSILGHDSRQSIELRWR